MNRLLPAILLALAACARLPTDLPPRPDLEAPATAATFARLAGESDRGGVAAVAECWWESFGLADLDRLIDRALKNHPDLAAAQARLVMAEQTERLARLQSQVNYASDASLVREHLSRNGLFPPPIGGSTLTQTDVTQNIYYDLDWWGKNRALVLAAGNAAEAARDEAAAVRLALAAAVADAYFAWADVAARLALARELENRHRCEAALAQTRFDLGLDAASPLIEARKKLDLDEDRIRALEYLDRAGRYRLAALAGDDPDHAAALVVPSLDGRLADLPDKLPLDWLARRPEVAALRARVAAGAARSQAARADFYPNIDLRLMLGLETLDLGKLLQAGSLSASLGPAIHLPLFNGSTLSAKLRLQEADYAAAVADYNRAVIDGAAEAASAYALLVSLEQRARAQEQAAREARRTFDLARRRQELGLAAALDGLEADAALLSLRLDQTANRAALLRARVRLFKALGGGIADSKG